MNIRDFVSSDHIESPYEIIQTQSSAIQAYMLENEQLQKELKKVYDELTSKDKEIERLNNIINELEKCIKDEYDYCDKRFEPMFGIGMGVTRKLLDKLKELKEGK